MEVFFNKASLFEKNTNFEKYNPVAVYEQIRCSTHLLFSYLLPLIHILKFFALNLILTYTSPDWHPWIKREWWSSICFGSDSSSMFVMDILSKLRTLSSYRILKPTQLYGPGIEQVVVVVLLLPTTYYSYWVSNRKFRENKICDTLQTTSKYTTTNFLKWRECNCTILYH